MEVQSIIQQIRKLPLNERFLIIEQTLKSIKTEELQNQSQSTTENMDHHYSNIKDFNDFLISEKSLAADWLSEEDNRWDNLL